MGLKPKFTQKSFTEEALKQQKRIEAAITQMMSVVGVKGVNHARLQGAYTDQTGNLRNSTGYLIVRNGSILKEDFQKTVSGSVPTTVDGVAVGRNLAYEIAADFSNFRGWALIIVAGMSYAASVEYLHGKNVLAETEIYIRELLGSEIIKLKSKIDKMAA